MLIFPYFYDLENFLQRLTFWTIFPNIYWEFYGEKFQKLVCYFLVCFLQSCFFATIAVSFLICIYFFKNDTLKRFNFGEKWSGIVVCLKFLFIMGHSFSEQCPLSSNPETGSISSPGATRIKNYNLFSCCCCCSCLRLELLTQFLDKIIHIPV